MVALTGQVQALVAKWRAQAETWARQDAHMRATVIAEEVLRDLEALGGTTTLSAEAYTLTVDQVAPVMGVTPQWIYRHWRTLPFAKKYKTRMLRFSEAGMHRWLSER